MVLSAVVLATLALGDRCAEARTGQLECGFEHAGSAVATSVDGTWVVDEERDEIAFVADAAAPVTTALCSWPERVIVTTAGRAFVSCRGSGTVAVLDREGFGVELPVGFEPRALALDERTQSLFVGVSAPASIVEVDTATLRVRSVTSTPFPPDELALSPVGLTFLARKGGEIGVLSLDEPAIAVERLPPSHLAVTRIFIRGSFGLNATQSWHGQALVRTAQGIGVIYARVSSGGDNPSPSGRYGGEGRDDPPFQLMFTELDGNGQLRHPGPFGPFLDVTGAQTVDGELFVTARNQRTLFRGSLKGAASQLRPDVEVGLGAVGLSLAPNGALRVFDSFDRQLLTVARTGEEPGTNDGRRVLAPVALAPGKLSPSARRGQELFHSSSATLSANGISCAGCHPDGREDGLVWSIDGDIRQTPLLAGRISDTAPFGWLGENAVIEENLKQTIHRLGGGGLTEDELKALGEFVRVGLRSPPPLPVAAPPELVAHGRKVFEGEAECATCHDGAALTDGESYTLGYGRKRKLKFNTPSLRFLSRSAPYLHDGSVKSLEELVADPKDRMGKTSTLSADDRTALVAYLHTL